MKDTFCSEADLTDRKDSFRIGYDRRKGEKNGDAVIIIIVDSFGQYRFIIKYNSK